MDQKRSKALPKLAVCRFSSEKIHKITRSLPKTKCARVLCRHLVLTNISQKGHMNALKIPPSLKPRQLLKFGENVIPAQLRRAASVLLWRRTTGASISATLPGSCPLLPLLPWLDTSGAAVIGPRSDGLCWWSQRVRKAWARVVPVHHPVRDSLPGRSFAEQRAHIVAARGPPQRPEQAVPSQRSAQPGKPQRSCAISTLKMHFSGLRRWA